VDEFRAPRSGALLAPQSGALPVAGCRLSAVSGLTGRLPSMTAWECPGWSSAMIDEKRPVSRPTTDNQQPATSNARRKANKSPGGETAGAAFATSVAL